MPSLNDVNLRWRDGTLERMRSHVLNAASEASRSAWWRHPPRDTYQIDRSRLIMIMGVRTFDEMYGRIPSMLSL